MDERALERLIIDNPAFDTLASAMGVFCPFDAVGMADQEVRHGRFLQYILDPARPHGFGAECLRAFMRSVAGTLTDAGLGFAPLDVHLMELDAAVVHRERDAIDLVIEVAPERLIVAIELKINASEHSGQLGRYRRIVERDWPAHKHLLLFLTKRGDAPSADGAGWRALSLAPIADALAGVADKQIGDPAARMMLAAYVGMLRREHLTDDRLEALAAGLWREHREALEFLMERRPDTKYAALSAMLVRQEEAAQRLSQLSGFAIVADKATKSNVRFAVADWDALPGMRSAEKWTPSRRGILLELKESRGTVRAEFQLGPTPLRQKIFDALRDAGADTGYAGPINAQFRQLANASFATDPTDDSEIAFDKLLTSIARFLTKHVSTYSSVLRDTMR